MTYTPLRPDQMDNGGLDMSLEEDTSSMDEIAQKCPMKPQKKTKGAAFLHTHADSHNRLTTSVCYIHLSLMWLIVRLLL